LKSPKRVLTSLWLSSGDFPAVIGQSAYAFVLAHNHPSGEQAPSEGDIRLIRLLVQGARILPINILDHVIVGQPGYFSFKKAGIS
jgi:DNA repair protein RadC